MVLICLLLMLSAVPALSAEHAVHSLEASIRSNTVTITGTHAAGEGKQVTVRVVDPDSGLAYLNQTTSGAGGSFSFSYGLKAAASAGTYTVYMGGEGVSGPVTTTFVKKAEASTGSSGNNGGSSGDGGKPTGEQDTEVVRNPSANADGKVVVTIAKGTKKVWLPANAAALHNNNTLTIQRDDVELEVDGEVLEALKRLLAEGDLADANIALEIDEMTSETADELLSKAALKSKANVKAAGAVFIFKLSIVSKDGEVKQLTSFSKPVILTLHVSEGVNQDLIGVYYIADDGALDYVGGKLTGNKIKAAANHFSKYAVLEYDKSFDDVSEQHWAYDVIKKMAAKHVVSGVSETEFAPEKPVTRAEFAALIVRALGLEATGEAGFKDVDSTDWYADAVAAAYEAGIVSGRSIETFVPDDIITRQEMAIMIVRAYELKSGKTVTAGSEAGFADGASISAWAQDAVNAAAELGIIKGRANDRFVPHGHATRAEAVQVISQAELL